MKKLLALTMAFLMAACVLCSCAAPLPPVPEVVSVSENLSENISESLGEAPGGAYGELAYGYLLDIAKDFAGRICFTQKDYEMAEYIIAALKNAGYSDADIEVQRFEPTAYSEMAANWFRDNATQERYRGGKWLGYSQNIIVTKKGDSDKVIVVGCHIDSVDNGGISDNGAGIAAVLESAERMFGVRTPYTIRYAFFGGEEVGLCQGSMEYVESLTDDEKENILLMVNLDVLLDAPGLNAYSGRLKSLNGAPEFIDDIYTSRANELIRNSGLDIHQGTIYEGLVELSDHRDFLRNGVSCVTFFSVYMDSIVDMPDGSGITWDYMHSAKDTLDYIRGDDPGRIEKTLKSIAIILETLLLEGFAA